MCPPIPHGSQPWCASAPPGRGCFGQGGLDAPKDPHAQGTAQGTPPPASQGTHSLPSHPSPQLLRSPRQPVGQRGALRAHGAGYQPMDRERGRGRAYGSSWRSGRPLKEGQGKWVKGRWHSPGAGTAGSGVGDRRVAPRHSPAPHGHLCSLVLRGCPAGKRDRVRGGGDRGHMG